MPRDRDSSTTRAPPKKGTYVFASSVIEDASSEPVSTYGVQFAWKPCKEHIQGGGRIWKGRGPVGSGQRNGLASQAVDDDAVDDDAVDDDAVDDEAVDDDAVVEVVEEGDANPKLSEKFLEERWRNLFVTCNGYAVRVYEAVLKQKPKLLQVFEDEDTEEQFYCVVWTYNANNNHEWWACAAGKKGVLRVLNVQRGKLHSSLVGHGEAINDIKVHPRDPALVLTASKDESLRLWNLRTGSTVAVFAGLKGHRGEVVHADFNRDGSKFASCGIDNSVRIWDVYDNENVVAAIKESHKVADLGVTDPYVYRDETGTRRKAKVPISQFPFFVTRKVHKHYVDCVMWVGDLLLSKSVHNRIFLWEAEADRESLASPATEYTLLEEYVLEVCNVWFIRFALDRRRKLVACGNDKGTVRVFDLEVVPSKELCTVQPKDRHRTSAQFVRQCAFSDDGSILIAVDDSSSVVQYERVE